MAIPQVVNKVMRQTRWSMVFTLRARPWKFPALFTTSAHGCFALRRLQASDTIPTTMSGSSRIRVALKGIFVNEHRTCSHTTATTGQIASDTGCGKSSRLEEVNDLPTDPRGQIPEADSRDAPPVGVAGVGGAGLGSGQDQRSRCAMTKPVHDTRKATLHESEIANMAMDGYTQAAAEAVADYGDTITDTHPHAIAVAYMQGAAVIHAAEMISTAIRQHAGQHRVAMHELKETFGRIDEDISLHGDALAAYIGKHGEAVSTAIEVHAESVDRLAEAIESGEGDLAKCAALLEMVAANRRMERERGDHEATGATGP